MAARSRFLDWDGHITEMALFDEMVYDALRNPAADQCPGCAGTGRTVEQLDDDRFPVTVPCDRCKGKGVLDGRRQTL